MVLSFKPFSLRLHFKDFLVLIRISHISWIYPNPGPWSSYIPGCYKMVEIPQEHRRAEWCIKVRIKSNIIFILLELKLRKSKLQTWSLDCLSWENWMGLVGRLVIV